MTANWLSLDMLSLVLFSVDPEVSSVGDASELEDLSSLSPPVPCRSGNSSLNIRRCRERRGLKGMSLSSMRIGVDVGGA